MILLHLLVETWFTENCCHPVMRELTFRELFNFLVSDGASLSNQWSGPWFLIASSISNELLIVWVRIMIGTRIYSVTVVIQSSICYLLIHQDMDMCLICKAFGLVVRPLAPYMSIYLQGQFKQRKLRKKNERMVLCQQPQKSSLSTHGVVVMGRN